MWLVFDRPGNIPPSSQTMLIFLFLRLRRSKHLHYIKRSRGRGYQRVIARCIWNRLEIKNLKSTCISWHFLHTPYPGKNLAMVLHTSKWNDSNAKFPSPCLNSTKDIVHFDSASLSHPTNFLEYYWQQELFHTQPKDHLGHSKKWLHTRMGSHYFSSVCDVLQLRL